MGKARTLNGHEAQYEALAKLCLAGTQKVHRQLASKRQRSAHRARPYPSLLAEVKEILYGK
jgi:hypothetical protein